MQKFEAVLLDIDGTILDTTEFIFQAFEHTIKKFELPTTSRDVLATFVGRPLFHGYTQISKNNNVKVEDLATAHREFQLNHLDLSKPYPGTIETLETLRKASLKIATVTTRARESSIRTLDYAKLTRFIDYVVAFDDVINPKPDPEPVLKALQYINASAENSIMVGDSDADIYAGKNAGTKTVGATYGFHGIRIAESRPDYLINSIQELIPLVLPTLEYRDKASVLP